MSGVNHQTDASLDFLLRDGENGCRLVKRMQSCSRRHFQIRWAGAGFEAATAICSVLQGRMKEMLAV